MIAWFIAAIACLYALSLARRLAEMEEELYIKRSLHLQAEQRCEQLEKRRRRLVDLNRQLIAEHSINGVIYIDQNGRVHD